MKMNNAMQIYCRSIRPDGYGEGVVPEMKMPDFASLYYAKGSAHDDAIRDWNNHLVSLSVLYLIHPDLAKVGWVGEHKEGYENYYWEGGWKECSKDIYDDWSTSRRRIVLVPVEGKEERYEVFESNNDCPGRWVTVTKQEYDACTFEPHRRIITSDKAEEKEVVSDDVNFVPDTVPDYMVRALDNYITASNEFHDGYRNENGKITRINIAALSTALNQAETSLRKAYNRFKAHSKPTPVTGEAHFIDDKQGWAAWEKDNQHHPKGINPSAYLIGYKAGKQAASRTSDAVEGRPVLVERFADNGEHSHWELIDEKTGKTLYAKY